MATVSATNLLTPSASAPKAGALSELGTQDFLKLLLTELTNQDPLEPTDNEALLRQISSIRDIEMSTALTDSMRRLTGQQQIGAASALIGQFVSGLPGEDGTVASGLVMGVRFAEGGRPLLQLSRGAEMPLEAVASMQPALQAAERLIGATVVGIDRRNAIASEMVQGVVSGVTQNSTGEVFVELDTGADLRLRDVLTVVAGEAQE